jgi:MarR family transcriptional regulator, organic hydroperoxide resistance regulator
MTDESARSDYPFGPPLEFLRRIWRLNHALERTSHRMLGQLGLTAQQRFLLRCIGQFPGITPGDVARALHIDPGTVSATLRRLENKGLAKRRKDPADQRRAVLGLTPAGHALDGPAEGTVETAVATLLATTSVDEIQITLRVLARLATLLEASSEPVQ